MSRNPLTVNMQMCRNTNLNSQGGTLRKYVVKTGSADKKKALL